MKYQVSFLSSKGITVGHYSWFHTTLAAPIAIKFNNDLCRLHCELAWFGEPWVMFMSRIQIFARIASQTKCFKKCISNCIMEIKSFYCDDVHQLQTSTLVNFTLKFRSSLANLGIANELRSRSGQSCVKSTVKRLSFKKDKKMSVWNVACCARLKKHFLAKTSVSFYFLPVFGKWFNHSGYLAQTKTFTLNDNRHFTERE